MAANEIDLSEEQFGRSVPFGTFARLRATAPVWWYERDRCWVVTSYRDVERVNRDPKVFSSAGGPIPPDDPGHPELPIMLADDPPVHTGYRRLVAGYWTPRAVARHRELVQEVVDEVVREFREKGGGDFVADVAGPIPFRIIAALVGIPPEDAPLLWRWTNTLMPSKDPDYRADADAPARARAGSSTTTSDSCSPHIGARRARISPMPYSRQAGTGTHWKSGKCVIFSHCS